MKKNNFLVPRSGNWKKLLLTMKLCLLFLLISAASLMASSGYSQNTTLSIHLKNATLRDLINEVEKQSEFIFVFYDEVVDLDRKIDVQIENQTIDKILDKILKSSDLTYRIFDRQIGIGKRDPVTHTIEQSLPLDKLIVADKILTGRVTDIKGISLPGVSVVVKGTTQGTITDMNGKFTLTNVPANAKILLFSFVGMKSQEVPIGNKVAFTIKMEDDNVGIEEVVAIGYGSMKRIDLTGSVGSVQIKELTKAPVKSFDDALAGRVAGVSVTSGDGQPGTMPEIVIRGGNSITQGNTPLYVIDGFPLETNNNNSINPADIESIDILKDASATAIYGARGANGVILITTKSGKQGTPKVSFNSYYGIQKDINELDLLNPYDFVALQLELDPTYGPGIYLTTPGRTLDDYKNMKAIDWYSKVLRTAPMKNYDVSISGGTPLTKYYISGSYLGQDGIFISSGFRRYQGRISLDQEISKKLKTRFNVNYSNTKDYGTVATNNGGSASASLMYSIWSYRPINTNSTAELEDQLSDPAVNPAVDYRINPFIQIQNELRENISQNLLANTSLEWGIIKGLTLRLTGGISGYISQSNNFNNSKTRTGGPGYPMSLGVNGSQTFSQGVTYSNENTLTYSTKFNGANSLSFVGGFSQQLGRNSSFGGQSVQITNETLGLSGMDEGVPRSITASSSNWSLKSFFGRVNYDYKSKYLFTATLRADGSSKFSEKNRWGYFPSTAIAYRLSNENFMKPLHFISNAKVRIGYGMTGSNRVSDFAYLSGIETRTYSGYSYGNATPSRGTYVAGINNSDLKWETTAQFDAGIDLAFLRNRISFTGDYYYKKTKDLLLNAQLPYATGYNTAYKNIGSVSNEGVELSLNTVNIQNAKFSWKSDFNISFNKSKVLHLTENQIALTSTTAAIYNSNPCYIAKVGEPVAMFYGIVFDGVYQYEDFIQRLDGSYALKDEIAANGAARTNIKPGDAKYKDINGDGNVDINDYTVIGNPNPDFIGGFNNTLEYKGFDLSLFLQFSYGNEVMNANRVVFENAIASSRNINQYASYANRWTTENPTSNIPRANGYGTNLYTTRIIEDASFLRLKTASLGYSLPSSMIAKLGIKSLRVYVSAQNLYTLTNYSGVDPEVSTRHSTLTPGFDYSPYPRQKTFVAGINLSF